MKAVSGKGAAVPGDISTTAQPDVGVDPDALKRLAELAASRVAPGPLPSCQLALARHGRVVLFASFGAATNETRYLIYSATKPIVASALWMLVAEGRLELSAPVAHYIPEFGHNGKQDVTVDQVLLHTSGFPNAPMERQLWTDRAGRLERFSEWKLEYEPGSAFGYHGSSAHWVLAELIERLGGRDYRDFVNDRLFVPLQLQDTSLGVPADQQHGIPQVVSIGSRGAPEETLAVKGFRGVPPARELDKHFLQYNLPESRSAGTPSSGCVTSAKSLALVYQALLNNPRGLWDADLLADATGNVRNRHPVAGLGVPADRSIGLLIAGKGPSHFRHLFGDGPSDLAFGHTGAAGQISWADPQSGVSFVFLTNALDADLMRQHTHQRELCTAAAAVALGAQS